MTQDPRVEKETRRLHRQFAVIARRVPGSRGMIDAVLDGRFRLVRVPIACALILGGLAFVMPLVGLWMLPLGLLVLALDVPYLRPAISAFFIRSRRSLRLWRRRLARTMRA